MRSRQRSRSSSLLVFCAATLVPVAATAQAPRRVQLQATALATGSRFLALGAGAGWDLGPRFDFTLSGVAGSRAGNTQLRLEGIFAFHLNFPSQEGWGFYGGGGLAAHLGPNSAQYLLLLAGIERNNRRGMFVEVGIGGGARLAAGYRLPVP